MTRIKLCGLSKESDILAANKLMPDYIGFVFWKKSSRYVTEEKAGKLKELLDPGIKATGVFVDEDEGYVASLLRRGIIDIAQLHGSEDDDYIKMLKLDSGKPVIKAFRIGNTGDVVKAAESIADHILLDSGAGGGKVLDRDLIRNVGRPYFLAGGLTPENVGGAVRELDPWAVDVSSGIETDGRKDEEKMRRFMEAVKNVKRGA